MQEVGERGEKLSREVQRCKWLSLMTARNQGWIGSSPAHETTAFSSQFTLAISPGDNTYSVHIQDPGLLILQDIGHISQWKRDNKKKKKNYELCSYQCGCREWAKLEEETKRGWWYATRLQSGWVFLGPMPLLFLVLDLTVCSLLAARAINCWSWGWGGGIFSKMQQPVHLSQMH